MTCVHCLAPTPASRLRVCADHLAPITALEAVTDQLIDDRLLSVGTRIDRFASHMGWHVPSTQGGQTYPWIQTEAECRGR